MNFYWLLAGILSFVLGLVHSVLGEYLIFRKKRKPNYLVPTEGGSAWREEHLRIVWASWHLASVFAWGIAMILLMMAEVSTDWTPSTLTKLTQVISLMLFLAAALVLGSTKAKHPGWFVILLIACLTCLGNGVGD